ncbi:diacylglycerol kinase [Georgenia wutianyii]|uniref:Diacylglycerol kinase n=1 Tax=Georgenia wutianyii TaxID=2585135 RepID=A0ABX5VIE8_9MICO|nr:diacylglycerol kinase family protein [Georgenia wutianyii]QDB78037.1 diacylglycerol kinase [Georgenia wutianyii]
MGWEQWVAVIALVVAVAGLVIGLVVLRALGRRTPPFSHEDPVTTPDERPSGPPAVVFNPSKSADGERLRALVAEVAADSGLPEPIWLETTVEDPGVGQVREALEKGASVIVAAGGDGTVRAVAEGLAGRTTPMGILPLGTGNLLARNLDLPLTGHRDMVTIALTGRNRAMDLGWLRIERPRAASDPEHDVYRGEPGRTEVAATPPGGTQAPDVTAGEVPGADLDKEHVFLVIGGMGFDAAMVGGAPDDLKARIGWVAYFVGGVRHLLGRKMRATLELGESGQSDTFQARTVLVANCGRLPGGVVLLPDAQLDDGWLDIAAIDTRGGIIGWADLLRKVVLQGLGVRRDLLPYSTGTIEFRRTRTLTIRTEEPEHVQVDGDLLGEATVVHARVQPAGLVVRTA